MIRSSSTDCWTASRRHCHRSRRASPLAATNALRKRQAERDIRLHVWFPLHELRGRERAVEMLAVGFVRLRAEGAVLGRPHRAPRRRDELSPAYKQGWLPPDTAMISPVTNDASSLARKQATSAISPASPNRFRNEAAVRRLAS